MPRARAPSWQATVERSSAWRRLRRGWAFPDPSTPRPWKCAVRCPPPLGRRMLPPRCQPPRPVPDRRGSLAATRDGRLLASRGREECARSLACSPPGSWTILIGRRNAEFDFRARARSGMDLHLAANVFDPSLHAAEHPDLPLRPQLLLAVDEAAAIIPDRHDHRSVIDLGEDGRARGLGMLTDVLQGLSHRPHELLQVGGREPDRADGTHGDRQVGDLPGGQLERLPQGGRTRWDVLWFPPDQGTQLLLLLSCQVGELEHLG